MLGVVEKAFFFLLILKGAAADGCGTKFISCSTETTYRLCLPFNSGSFLFGPDFQCPMGLVCNPNGDGARYPCEAKIEVTAYVPTTINVAFTTNKEITELVTENIFYDESTDLPLTEPPSLAVTLTSAENTIDFPLTESGSSEPPPTTEETLSTTMTKTTKAPSTKLPLCQSNADRGNYPFYDENGFNCSKYYRCGIGFLTLQLKTIECKKNKGYSIEKRRCIPMNCAA